MWKNELDSLKQMNIKNSKLLHEDDKILINKMEKYVSVARISRLESGRFKQDLIGLALEARLRGSTLYNELGMDIKSFCEETITNSSPTGWRENLLLLLKSVLTTLLCILLLSCFIYSDGQIPFGILDSILLGGFVLATSGLELFIAPRFQLETGLKSVILPLIEIIFMVVVLFIASKLSHLYVPLIIVQFWSIFPLLVGSLLVVSLLWRLELQRQIKQFIQ